MSLINQMLQDLDQRGSAAAGSDVSPARIRAVAVPGRDNRRRLAWRTVLLLMAILLAVIAGFFWQRTAAVVAAAKLPVSVQASQQHALPRTGDLRQSLSAAPERLALQEKSAPVAMPAAAAPVVPVTKLERAPDAKRAPVEPAAEPFIAALPVKPPVAAVPDPVPLSAGKNALSVASTNGNKNAQEPSEVKADEDGTGVRQSKEITPQQLTENTYRKALSRIDSGRLPEAIETLEQVLQLNPKHAAARQTLVGLLLEEKRQDDAVRKLQQGLAIDPTQSGMAMILARLQVERGNQRPALETLQRSLPHAADQADYQAFLAALLQREKRHKEAAEHYALALRKAPQNGLWWMGYGISLQADNHPAEAQDAFTRASASAMLSAELQAFVDQKLSQLQR
ncbi:MAG: tetratricopeptide repeat protein [Oxalobacteraceae bacterium]